MEKRISCRVGMEEEGLTLGRFLKDGEGLTKKQISQAKFRKKGICLNGKQARVSERLRSGDLVEVLLEQDLTGSDHLIPCKGEVEILYEDEDLLIVNKPAGIAVHPCGCHYGDSMANLLMNYFAAHQIPMRIRPIGRLDLETSGVLVFAKNQVSAARLAAQKGKGIFYKEYLAIAEGAMEIHEGVIDSPIGQGQRGKMKVSCDGKRAMTRYQVIKSGPYSVVQVQIETGRTHQIRVHMASIGHPLMGDILYGGRRDFIERTALHARKVTLCQPFTGKEILVEAKLPQDMAFMIKDGLPSY